MANKRNKAWDRVGSEPIGVAVLGATGSVGQRFVQLLADHPWFELRVLCASPSRAGTPYGETVRWVQDSDVPVSAASLPLQTGDMLDLRKTPLVFSALPGLIAGPLETRLSRAGFWVVSNASSHRMDPDVPLMVPEVNGDHLELLGHQAGPGALIAGPNCSAAGLMLALAPLHREFEIKDAFVVTMQAHSGAGLPGVLGPIADHNVLPHIEGEEEKLNEEPHKILGRLDGASIRPASFRISAMCHRVPIIDGHTEAVSVRFGRAATREQVLAAWKRFEGLDLPSAPRQPVAYVDELLAPNPKSHVSLGGGMATSVGQLRPCSLLDWKFTLLSHNTLRGAAGGAILIAEQAIAAQTTR